MQMITRIGLLLMLLTTLVSCSKDELKPLIGEYSGEFYGNFPGHSGLKKSDAKITLRLDGEEFVSSAGPGRFPAGGSGSYALSDEGLILFEDKNVWTADFDWNLILNGKFDYKIKGDSLILTRYYPPCPSCNYLPPNQYRLKRLD